MFMPRIAQPHPTRQLRLHPDADGGQSFSGEHEGHTPTVLRQRHDNVTLAAKAPAGQNLDDARKALAAGQRVRLNISL